MASKRGPRAKGEQLARGLDKARDDLRWWLKDDPHEAVFRNWRRIGSRTRARRMEDLYHACLYDDAELIVALGGEGAIGEFTPQTLSTNICRVQVDTFVSRVCKSRPVPMGLTTGGNYSEQRRAKALSKFFAGILDEVKYWPTRRLRRRDAGIFGSGLALNWRDGRTIHHDRLLQFEARTDPRESIYGHPRTLYIGRYMDRAVLNALTGGKFAEQIEDADSRDETDHWQIGLDDTSDVVLTIMSWHLPSSSTANDGAYTLCISNATLDLDEYTRPTFPVSKYDFAPSLFGWHGEGLIKQLRGLQQEVNDVGLRLQERNYLMGTYVLRRTDSNVDYDAIDNGSLTEVVWDGAEPKFVQPPAAHPQLFDWYSMLRTQMPAEISRQSQFSTRSELPKGIDGSGKAQRTYLQNEQEGFAPQIQADEEDVIDTCWQLFDLAEEIYEESKQNPEVDGDDGDRGGAYVVQVEDRKYGRSELAELKYADVRLDRRKFKLRIFPTNFLSGTPEDKYATVSEMKADGFLSEDEAMMLLDFPDVQHVMDLRTSARRVVERLLDKIREASDPATVYAYPEPSFNLDLCIALGQQHYLEGRLDGVPEKNLKWVIQFALDADALQKGKAFGPRPDDGGAPPDAEPPPPPPPDAGGPPAAPPVGMAPPAAPLLPAGAVAPTAIPNVPPQA